MKYTIKSSEDFPSAIHTVDIRDPKRVLDGRTGLLRSDVFDVVVTYVDASGVTETVPFSACVDDCMGYGREIYDEIKKGTFGPIADADPWLGAPEEEVDPRDAVIAALEARVKNLEEQKGPPHRAE